MSMVNLTKHMMIRRINNHKITVTLNLPWVIPRIFERSASLLDEFGPEVLSLEGSLSLSNTPNWRLFCLLLDLRLLWSRSGDRESKRILVCVVRVRVFVGPSKRRMFRVFLRVLWSVGGGHKGFVSLETWGRGQMVRASKHEVAKDKTKRECVAFSLFFSRV